MTIPRPPHHYVPYPSGRVSACLKCGKPKDDPTHTHKFIPYPDIQGYPKVCLKCEKPKLNAIHKI